MSRVGFRGGRTRSNHIPESQSTNFFVAPMNSPNDSFPPYILIWDHCQTEFVISHLPLGSLDRKKDVCIETRASSRERGVRRLCAPLRTLKKSSWIRLSPNTYGTLCTAIFAMAVAILRRSFASNPRTTLRTSRKADPRFSFGFTAYLCPSVNAMVVAKRRRSGSQTRCSSSSKIFPGNQRP